MIHVCSLARLHPTVESTGARHVVTLLRDIHLVSRPSTIALDNHLVLAMDDISIPLEGYSAPADEHVTELVKFLHGWSPNTRIVELADRLLGRRGRMIRAVEAIGRGIEAFEAHPFRLELE